MVEKTVTSPHMTSTSTMATETKAPKAKPSLDVYKQSFREYLRETDAVSNETELTNLMTLLHEPLPVSFRLNLHRPDAE
ncbi:hypothetical protein BBJ29_004812, partial [Phytophthora kernoviae]